LASSDKEKNTYLAEPDGGNLEGTQATTSCLHKKNILYSYPVAKQR
jgi:hypothetical protein